MTARRDLKRRTRQRQEQTGERYTTARSQVLAATREPIGVVELEDIGERARAAGLLCPTRITPDVARFADELPKLLEQLRRILAGPTRGLEAMRRAALDGVDDGATDPLRVRVALGDWNAFFEGLRAGLRGPGPGGRIVAFDAELGGAIRAVVASLVPRFRAPSLLVLALYPDDLLLDWRGALLHGRMVLP
jgi:hypothetical protein